MLGSAPQGAGALAALSEEPDLGEIPCEAVLNHGGGAEQEGGGGCCLSPDFPLLLPHALFFFFSPLFLFCTLSRYRWLPPVLTLGADETTNHAPSSAASEGFCPR